MFRRFLTLAVLPLLAGCAGAYFEAEDTAPSSEPRRLADWPYGDYWTGLVFNGSKIGFTHLELVPQGEPPDTFLVRSDAAMRFRLLAVDKQVTLKAADWVDHDLTLKRFDYAFDLDGNRLAITGRVHADTLETTVVAGGVPRHDSVALDGPLYPSSAIALYPVLHGLEVGREYQYRIYDGESQRVAEVSQSVLAYERSELFDGPAHKVRTRLHGNEVDTWFDARGRPVLEMSLGGVFISGLESEAMARRHLALAALNKDETLLDFSRVPAVPPVVAPRQVTALTLELRGVPEDFVIPSDDHQSCRREGSTVLCRLRSGGAETRASAGGEGPREEYLRSTLPAPSRHTLIRTTASQAVDGISDRDAQAVELIRWIQDNVEQTAVDVFSAIDVLRTRKAECQGNSYLYTAFARSLGIPTRVVNGLVYSEYADGFVFHTWAESWIDGRWQAVDPTFGQRRADATHLKLVEGETLDQLSPMLGLIGRLEARVLAQTPGPV